QLRGVLTDEGDGDISGQMPRQIDERLHQLRADDEYDAAEPRAAGVMHCVIDQRFAVGADAFRLLRAAVSGTEAGSHDEQRRHTYVTSSSAREMFASPRSTRRGGDPKLMR